MGYSGSGKSTAAAWLLRKFPGPRVIIDPGNSAALALPGFATTSDPTGSTWGARSQLRYVPVDPQDQGLYAALYAALRSRVQAARGEPPWPGVVVLADEAETCLPSSATGPGPAFVFSGRKWPTGHIATATRPRNISTTTRANLTHAVIFPLWIEEDRKTLAGDLGVPLRVLEDQMGALPWPGHPVDGHERGFLWWTTATRSLQPVLT